MASKKFTDYLDPEPLWWTSKLENYGIEPASAFLREAVHLCDSMNQCKRLFKRKQNKSLNKDGQDSIYRLGAATLSAVMGHFETFQRSLFAGVVENSTYLSGFEVRKVCTKLQRDSNLALELERLLAYRGRSAQIGQLVADSLSSWHEPNEVNRHFHALVEYQFYSADDVEAIRLLWQLRHSVVHTAGWLTQADAQKHPELGPFAGRPILVNEHFTERLVRRLHKIVKASTEGYGKKFKAGLAAQTPNSAKKSIERLFKVESPRAWF